MLLFAQAAPPGIQNWIESYFYIVGGVFVTVGLIRSLKKREPAQTVISDQPLHVRAADEYVPRREHEELKREFRDLRAENKNLIAEQSKETRESISGVHDRITQLSTSFSEFRGEWKNANRFKAQA